MTNPAGRGGQGSGGPQGPVRLESLAHESEAESEAEAGAGASGLALTM